MLALTDTLFEFVVERSLGVIFPNRTTMLKHINAIAIIVDPN